MTTVVRLSQELECKGRKIRPKHGHRQNYKYPIEIAKRLGKSNHKKYTSHSWKRTASNLASEGGISASQLTVASRHRSQKTAIEYLATSKRAKLQVASYMDTTQMGYAQGNQSGIRCSFSVDMFFVYT